MKHFLIDKNYGAYLSAMGFSMEEVLRKAELSEDFFARNDPSMTAGEYFRFMQAVDELSPDEQTPVKLASAEGTEAFSPPIFAAYCSRNALACLKRLEQYKPLIGALLYKATETEDEVSVELISGSEEKDLPEILVGIEFVFITGLIRRATKTNVIPLGAEAKFSLHNKAYSDFLDRDIEVGESFKLTFSKSDALLPFISRNESMWEFFEPELNKRLALMETDNSYSAWVRSALMELLPSGECSAEDAAKKLGYSKRSLQRKLKEENTTFQKQLNHTRELLAKTYISNTQMTAEDIAFLLGYRETGSFLRAFAVWTGMTVSEYRAIVKTE